jgi:hypothetical protein
MKEPDIYRAWINQPSTNDLFHDLHGTYCIVADHGNTCRTVEAYFVSGAIHSMIVPRTVVSRVHLSSATKT